LSRPLRAVRRSLRRWPVRARHPRRFVPVIAARPARLGAQQRGPRAAPARPRVSLRRRAGRDRGTDMIDTEASHARTSLSAHPGHLHGDLETASRQDLLTAIGFRYFAAPAATEAGT